jgi:hypothetical protein
VLPQLHGAWAGDAAELAKGQVRATGTALSQPQIKKIVSALQGFADNIEACANELKNIIQDVKSYGMTVDLQTGIVGALLVRGSDFTYDPGVAAKATEDIEMLMARADRLDQQVASDLKRLFPALGSPASPVPAQYVQLENRENIVLKGLNGPYPSPVPATAYTAAQQEEIARDPAALSTIGFPYPTSAAQAADEKAAGLFGVSPSAAGATTASPSAAPSAAPSASPYVADMEAWGKEMGATAPASPAPAASQSPTSSPPPGVTQAEWDVS